MEDILVFAMRL